MISILKTNKPSSRTFGWIQDPNNFRSLCDVVAIFDNKSQKHKELITKTLPTLVLEKDGRDKLIVAMENKPLKLKYSDLVGTSFTPRSSSRYNGIVQATVFGRTL